MSVALIPLALLMGAVTYPFRALPLVIPGRAQIPGAVREYLRLAAPSLLASLAAIDVFLRSSDGVPTLQVGIEAAAVLLGAAVMAWRRNLLLAILAATFTVAVARALA